MTASQATQEAGFVVDVDLRVVAIVAVLVAIYAVTSWLLRRKRQS